MEKLFDEITTSELRNLIDDPKTMIIDVRPVDAYNGWKLENEPRGGHVKNARSLSKKWTKYIDWIEIVRSKGIFPDHNIVLYGYQVGDSQQVAQLFDRAGYKDIKIYNSFVEEWAADENLPMEKLANYRQLVSAQWLNTLLSGEKPMEYENGENYVICHAHYRNRADYEKGHIPGAIDLDTLKLESPETWNRRSPAELKKALQELGITSDTTVILYGRFSFPDNKDPFPGSSAGHLGAIRCAFIMMYAGVKDVRVLNGGAKSWEDAGYEFTQQEVKPREVGYFGLELPGCPGLAVDVPEAKKLLQSPHGELVCVRSWNEFIGEVSGYNYIEKTGRIPGAIFGNCGTDAYHMENYRNLDHTTREFNDIRESWNEVGITPDKHLAFYCGTGWRGSEAFFNAYLMGWPKVSVFDGGWFEWSSDPSNPVETGIPD